MADHPHEGHRGRLRERFRTNSLSGFASHEALELLLSYCIPKRDVNPLAHALIDRFGSFSGVLDAAPEELERVSGIGEYSATFLNLVAQAAGYYQRDKYRSLTTLMTVPDMGKYCMSLFLNDTSEKLYLVALNIHGQLLGSHLICSGSLDELIIYPRHVVDAALRSNAYAVVITHNHPGGSLYPSKADEQTTKLIHRALSMIDVSLLDHIIVGGGRYASMTAQGYLDDARENDPMLSMYMSCLDDDEDDMPPARKARSGKRKAGQKSAKGKDDAPAEDGQEVKAATKRKAGQKQKASDDVESTEPEREVTPAATKRKAGQKRTANDDSESTELEREATPAANKRKAGQKRTASDDSESTEPEREATPAAQKRKAGQKQTASDDAESAEIEQEAKPSAPKRKPAAKKSPNNDGAPESIAESKHKSGQSTAKSKRQAYSNDSRLPSAESDKAAERE